MATERSIILPDEMRLRLQQLLTKRERGITESDLIREAIRGRRGGYGG